MAWLSGEIPPHTRKERHSGKSTYSFSKKLKYFIDGIMGYSLQLDPRDVYSWAIYFLAGV